VFSVVELQSLELTVVVDSLGQVIDLTYFHWFDIEFIVFTFAYYYWLFILLEILIIIFRKLVLKTHFVIIDYVMVVIDLIIDLRLGLSFLFIPDYQVFKVVFVHKWLEPVVSGFFIISFEYLVVDFFLWFDI